MGSRRFPGRGTNDNEQSVGHFAVKCVCMNLVACWTCRHFQGGVGERCIRFQAGFVVGTLDIWPGLVLWDSLGALGPGPSGVRFGGLLPIRLVQSVIDLLCSRGHARLQFCVHVVMSVLSPI